MASNGFDSLAALHRDIVALGRPRAGEPLQALQIELKSAWARCPRVGTLVDVLCFAQTDDCLRLGLACVQAAAAVVPLAAGDRRLAELLRGIDDWTRGHRAPPALRPAVEEAIRYLDDEKGVGDPGEFADLVLAAASFLGEAALAGAGAFTEIRSCVSTLEYLERRLPLTRFDFADLARRVSACPSAAALVDKARQLDARYSD